MNTMSYYYYYTYCGLKYLFNYSPFKMPRREFYFYQMRTGKHPTKNYPIARWHIKMK
jgi:hypothetical protein